MKLNEAQQQELWRWAVHNRVFELSQTLSEIHSTFNALCEERFISFDKFTLIKQQMRIVSLELDKLRTGISNFNFQPEKEPE